MTQIGEAVGMALGTADGGDGTKCEHKPAKEKWKCKLDGESSVLASNITRDRKVAKPATAAKEADLSKTCWPSQAHHLIPWQQLQKHEVTGWLTVSPKKGPKRLNGDNDYSVDHGRNGVFMPYAASLAEWKTGGTKKKQALSYKVMRLARMQLHQGPHSYKPYGVGEAGYKQRVDQYLKRLHDAAIAHATTCQECKDKDDAKRVKPRRNMVRAVDGASAALENDVRAAKIFVSRRAAEYMEAFGNPADDSE